jgi:hypothetical protein
MVLHIASEERRKTAIPAAKPYLGEYARAHATDVLCGVSPDLRLSSPA